MQIDQSKNGSVAVLTLTGDLDSFSSIYLKERLGKLFTDSTYEVIIDLNMVDFVDSAGLGQLVSALKMCVHHKGNLMLVGVNKSIMDLLKITKLDTVFRIYDSVEDAVAGFTD